jgi:hypothetical protein
MQNASSNPPFDLNTPATKILAIGQFTSKAADMARRLPVMAREVPATLRLYLAGKIEQWFIKPDLSGPVFILNVSHVEDARELLTKLPLGLEGMMEFSLIPLGPLTPLRLLLQEG